MIPEPMAIRADPEASTRRIESFPRTRRLLFASNLDGSGGLLEYALKRPLDILVATTGLLLLSPVWFVVTLAILLEDGPPILFRQKRWGRNGRPFTAFKFRSMVKDADTLYGSVQAGEGDPRITRVGRILRATAMDELPQVINILRGDMSFVGPRALPINERQQQEGATQVADNQVPFFEWRTLARPGLTGVAQVLAARDVSRRSKFRYDKFYVLRQSLVLDAWLFFVSIWITLRARWESRGEKVRRPRFFPRRNSGFKP